MARRGVENKRMMTRMLPVTEYANASVRIASRVARDNAVFTKSRALKQSRALAMLLCKSGRAGRRSASSSASCVDQARIAAKVANLT